MEEVEGDLIERIGEQLKKTRIEKGLSQMDAAANAGIDKSAYQRIERGRTNPSVKMLERVLKGMDISIFDFFCEMKSQ